MRRCPMPAPAAGAGGALWRRCERLRLRQQSGQGGWRRRRGAKGQRTVCQVFTISGCGDCEDVRASELQPGLSSCSESGTSPPAQSCRSIWIPEDAPRIPDGLQTQSRSPPSPCRAAACSSGTAHPHTSQPGAYMSWWPFSGSKQAAPEQPAPPEAADQPKKKKICCACPHTKVRACCGACCRLRAVLLLTSMPARRMPAAPA